MALAQGSNFPAILSDKVVSLVKGKSSIARLAGTEAIKFNGTDVFTFSFDNEASIVGENEQKVEGGATITPIQIRPFKIEYGTRVSDEFKYATEEVKMDMLKEFIDGFSKKAARALDIAAFHGVNPRSGSASTVVGNNNLDYIIANYNSGSNVITYDSSDPNANMEDAISAVLDNEFEVNGAAIAPSFRSALAAQTKTDGDAMFPDLAWGGGANETAVIKGLPLSTNSTVSFNSSDARAYVGDFQNYFKWGVAKDMFVKVIEYGDPDNTGVDLAGSNQVYIRGEIYIGYGIMTAGAFATVAVGE